MAVMPGITYSPLGRQTQPRISRHDVLCLHTMVGSLSGTAAMFARDGFTGTESHFGVGGRGEVIQWQDTDFTADANYRGGHRILSVETADKGAPFPAWSGSDVPAWTDEQLDALAAIAVWAHRTHGIPLALCPDSKPGSRGIALHRQGVDGNGSGYRVPGGELWSTARGKVCPGDRRASQVGEVLRRALVLNGTPGSAAPVFTAPAPAVSGPGPITILPAPARVRDVETSVATQRALRVRVDGYWGDDTDQAVNVVREAINGRFPLGVKRAQQVTLAKADGIWGPKSRAALANTIAELQEAWHRYGAGRADGIWGPATQRGFEGARNACFKVGF